MIAAKGSGREFVDGVLWDVPVLELYTPEGECVLVVSQKPTDNPIRKEWEVFHCAIESLFMEKP